MENLYTQLETSDLVALKDKYAGNDSIAKLVDGIIEARLKELNQAEVNARFTQILDTTFNNPECPLTCPEGITNVFIHLGEVEEEKVVRTDTIGKGKNKQKVDVVEKVKVMKWIIEPNKVMTFHKATGQTTKTTSNKKLAITVYKKNGTTLEAIGNFPNASKACEYLKLNLGGDSGNRVLARFGYITEAYQGEDFTS